MGNSATARAASRRHRAMTIVRPDTLRYSGTLPGSVSCRQGLSSSKVRNTGCVCPAPTIVQITGEAVRPHSSAPSGDITAAKSRRGSTFTTRTVTRPTTGCLTSNCTNEPRISACIPSSVLSVASYHRLMNWRDSEPQSGTPRLRAERGIRRTANALGKTVSGISCRANPVAAGTSRHILTNRSSAIPTASRTLCGDVAASQRGGVANRLCSGGVAL